MATPTPPESIDRPTRAALRRGLERLLAAEIAAHGAMRILHRRENPRASSYVADIVQLRFADGHREQLLCKYAHGFELTPPTPHLGLGHEARVYREVLAECPLTTPRFHGSFADDETGDVVCVIEFHPRAVPAAKATATAAIDELVRWLAGFHTWAADRLPHAPWDFLPRYDADTYALWLDRTCAVAQPTAAEHPWLDAMADAYRGLIPRLAASPVTVIHGEFTTRNALWDAGRILPIDWETAAVAPAEIDLAVFTYDWHPDDIRGIEATYVAARWGGSPPEGFAETLLAARLYAAFHWLFGTPGGVGAERIHGHLGALRDEAVRWGIVAE